VGPAPEWWAFEPFPGNHEFFYQSTMRLDNITLIKKAVTDRVGKAEFTVPSVVQGTEPGWEKYAGYSSAGFLSPEVDDAHPSISRFLKRTIRRIAEGALGRPPPQRLIVETTSIDTEITAGEPIDFMKIDVQGGETRALLGSDGMLRTRRINILYIEWSGDPGVIRALGRYGYRIYDSTYIATPRIHDVKPFEKMGFEFIDEAQLSTGKVAYNLRLTSKQLSPSEAIKMIRKGNLGCIHTDLIAVGENTLGRFLEAAERYDRRNDHEPPPP
jgi:FkbM family methyltransferase